MTLHEGATHEINSRWPEYKQRNVAMIPRIYGQEYESNMFAGIQLVRDHYRELKSAGAAEWTISRELSDMLDSLVVDEAAFRI